jgi:rubredoxin
MPCPDCGNKEDRLIIHHGNTYRKKDKDGKALMPISGKGGARIKRYQCTQCGYVSRGSKFGLPETDEEEKKIPQGVISHG